MRITQYPTAFWMVYGMNQGAPTVRHESFAMAKAEAERLARNNPGVEFYVLATCGMARRQDVDFINIQLDEFLPF